MQRIHNHRVDSEIYHAEITATAEHIFLTELGVRYLRTATPFAETAVCAIGWAVDSGHLVCRPCRCSTSRLWLRHKSVCGNRYGFGQVRLLIYYIYRVDKEKVRGVRIQTRYGNLPVFRYEISVKAIRQVNHMVFSHPIIVRSFYSNDCAVVGLANQSSANHHRFLCIRCRNPCRTIDAELKNLHSPLGSCFRAPETDITYFFIVSQFGYLISTTVHAVIANGVVAQCPCSTILREINMVILRTRALEHNIYFIYII